MTTLKEVDGDVTKIDGSMLAVARDKARGTFIGFYAFTPEASYIRGAGHWIQATGAVLAKAHGAQLVEMRKSFITSFDILDKKGQTPTDEKIQSFSTKGNPASWDTQQNAEPANK